MNKISKRDMYTALVDWANGDTTDFKYSMTDLLDFARNEIDILDRKAVKTRERAAKKREAGDELRDTLAGLLTDELQTIPELRAQLDDGDDLSSNKIAVRMSYLVNTGVAIKDTVMVEDANGHKSRKTAYRLSTGED